MATTQKPFINKYMIFIYLFIKGFCVFCEFNSKVITTTIINSISDEILKLFNLFFSEDYHVELTIRLINSLSIRKYQTFNNNELVHLFRIAI